MRASLCCVAVLFLICASCAPPPRADLAELRAKVDRLFDLADEQERMRCRCRSE